MKAKEQTQQEPSRLPTFAELSMSPEIAFKNDQFNALLNNDPPPSFIDEHPQLRDGGGKPLRYMKIDKIEFLLTKIFQQHRIEILTEGALFNACYVRVRLHYLHPLTGEWMFHDGLGAVGMQTDAGAKASDMGAIKQDAVMKGLPAAESYAVKDAAQKLGRLFGKDLNRKDAIAFTPERMSYATIFDNTENNGK